MAPQQRPESTIAIAYDDEHERPRSTTKRRATASPVCLARENTLSWAATG